MSTMQLPDPIPLQPFVPAAQIRCEQARQLRPPRRITVTEAAREHRIVRSPGGGYSGPWRDDELPYLVEPMDCVTSRKFTAVVFMGPAQSVKTAGLIENPVMHAILCDPADTLVVQTTENMARDFSRRRLDRMIDDMPELRSRLRVDNVLDKIFDGMILSLGHPTVSQLSGRPIPRVLITDRDRMDDNIDGEGDPFDLAVKRTQTFGSRAMTLVESSPGKPVLNPKWKRSSPHEAPPCHGIAGLYNRGDRRRRYWPCPSCNEYFEGSFANLQWDDAPEPAEAAESVVMHCPNGCVIEPRWKLQMTRVGVWCPEGQTVGANGILLGKARRSDIASFWLKGPAAALQSWRQMVERYLTARSEFERTGSEESLKTTVNTDQAEPYVSQAAQAGNALETDVLINRAEDYPLDCLPPEARFLVAAVDVQNNRFEVMVRAFGVDLESWVVARFKVFKSADGGRPVDPAKHAEDWDLLFEQVVERVYPWAEDEDGGKDGLAPLRMVVDSGGAPGVTAQAYRFWRRARRRGLGRRVCLSKGESRRNAPRVAVSFPDSNRKDRQAGARGEVPVLLFNPNLLKDEVDAQLRRTEPGPLQLHLPAALCRGKAPYDFFEEITSEIRAPDGKWIKEKARNESFDLLVMTQAGALLLRADRVDWNNPPAWARGDSPAPAPQPAQKEPAGRPEPALKRQGSFARRTL